MHVLHDLRARFSFLTFVPVLGLQALFDLPGRIQVLSMPRGADPSGTTERLYVLDIHNGCVRSLPLGLSPARRLRHHLGIVDSSSPHASTSFLDHLSRINRRHSTPTRAVGYALLRAHADRVLFVR